jgi:hypothetical protein
MTIGGTGKGNEAACSDLNHFPNCSEELYLFYPATVV